MSVSDADPIVDHMLREVPVHRGFRVIGKYVLYRFVARGGMGCVFRARDLKLGRDVAFKLMSPDLIGSSDAESRFLREGQVQAKFSHPHLVHVYDLDRQHGLLCLAMEWIDGEDLWHRMRRLRRAFTPQESVSVGWAVAAALGELHQRQVVHRDVKPNNVLVSSRGEIKLADLGLVRDLDTAIPTLTGGGLGTAPYMAPEQWESLALAGPPADIFSVGAMLHHLLSGQTPDWTGNAKRRFPRIDEVVSGLPTELAAVIDRCTESRPEDRYSSGSELRDAFGQLADFDPRRALDQLPDGAPGPQSDAPSDEELQEIATAVELSSTPGDWSDSPVDEPAPTVLERAKRRFGVAGLAAVALVSVGAIWFAMAGSDGPSSAQVQAVPRWGSEVQRTDARFEVQLVSAVALDEVLVNERSIRLEPVEPVDGSYGYRVRLPKLDAADGEWTWSLAAEGVTIRPRTLAARVDATPPRPEVRYLVNDERFDAGGRLPAPIADEERVRVQWLFDASDDPLRALKIDLDGGAPWQPDLLAGGTSASFEHQVGPGVHRYHIVAEDLAGWEREWFWTLEVPRAEPTSPAGGPTAGPGGGPIRVFLPDPDRPRRSGDDILVEVEGPRVPVTANGMPTEAVGAVGPDGRWQLKLPPGAAGETRWEYSFAAEDYAVEPPTLPIRIDDTPPRPELAILGGADLVADAERRLWTVRGIGFGERVGLQLVLDSTDDPLESAELTASLVERRDQDVERPIGAGWTSQLDIAEDGALASGDLEFGEGRWEITIVARDRAGNGGEPMRWTVDVPCAAPAILPLRRVAADDGRVIYILPSESDPTLAEERGANRLGADAVALQFIRVDGHLLVQETEVTVAQMRAFLGSPELYEEFAGRYPWLQKVARNYPGGLDGLRQASYERMGGDRRAYGNYPAAKLYPDEHMAFADWLSAETEMDVRLPTRDEWVGIGHVNRGGGDGRVAEFPYPFDRPLAEVAPNVRGVWQRTRAAVEAYTGELQGLLGLRHIGGNVSEWCVDNPGEVLGGAEPTAVALGGNFNLGVSSMGSDPQYQDRIDWRPADHLILDETVGARLVISIRHRQEEKGR